MNNADMNESVANVSSASSQGDPNSTPIDVLVKAINRVQTPACVGIDPVFSKLPAPLKSLDECAAIEAFSLTVLDCIATKVGVIKPQSACFERYGSRGYAVLEKVIQKANELGLIVILDAKRGDIGSSATHYAVGAKEMGAHFITVAPYMGPSSIEPFIDAGLGVFSLARTSNPDSDQVQLQKLADGSCVAHAMSSMISSMGSQTLGSSGLSNLGAVVGATKSADDVKTLRSLMPDQMFLVPGVGAQGGTVADVQPMTRPNTQSIGELGVIVNASRSVLYPVNSPQSSWESTIEHAASDFVNDLSQLAV